MSREQRYTEEIELLSKGQIGRRCYDPQGDWTFDAQEHYAISGVLWHSINEENLLHLLDKPGGAILRYHCSDPLDLSGEPEIIRTIVLRMEIIVRERRELIVKFGTNQTLLDVLEYSRDDGLREWVRQRMIALEFSVTLEASILRKKAAALLIHNTTFLPSCCDLLANIMGDDAYDLCTLDGYQILRDLGYPNPERYVLRRIIELSMYGSNDRSATIREIQELAVGLDQQRLREYAAPTAFIGSL